MSFFGITALGPPSSFQAGLVSALGINVFSVEEFEATFRRMDKDGSGAITADEVEDLLHDTYGFPPLEEEVAMFMDNFDLNQDGKVTWEEFRSTLERIRAETNKKSANAKEYTSYEKMRADRFKHIRMGKDIQDKYKVPMTTSQAHGFYVKDE
jgi:hypothetical protein